MKSKEKLREIIVRLVILFVGLTIAHLGVTLFLLADLGADPFNVLIQGIRLLLEKAGLSLTHGTVHAGFRRPCPAQPGAVPCWRITDAGTMAA